MANIRMPLEGDTADALPFSTAPNSDLVAAAYPNIAVPFVSLWMTFIPRNIWQCVPCTPRGYYVLPKVFPFLEGCQSRRGSNLMVPIIMLITSYFKFYLELKLWGMVDDVAKTATNLVSISKKLECVSQSCELDLLNGNSRG